MNLLVEFRRRSSFFGSVFANTKGKNGSLRTEQYLTAQIISQQKCACGKLIPGSRRALCRHIGTLWCHSGIPRVSKKFGIRDFSRRAGRRTQWDGHRPTPRTKRRRRLQNRKKTEDFGSRIHISASSAAQIVMRPTGPVQVMADPLAQTLVITPDNCTYQPEEQILRRSNRLGHIGLQVTSPRQLAIQGVSGGCGAAPEEFPDVERVSAVRKIIRQNADQLPVFGRYDASGFAAQEADTIALLQGREIAPRTCASIWNRAECAYPGSPVRRGRSRVGAPPRAAGRCAAQE